MVHHVIPYVNMNKVEPLSRYIENMEEDKKLEACCSLGIGNLNIKNEEELMDLIGVIEALFQSALPGIISGTENYQDIKTRFLRRLNIVKKAVSKEGV